MPFFRDVLDAFCHRTALVNLPAVGTAVISHDRLVRAQIAAFAGAMTLERLGIEERRRAAGTVKQCD